MKRALALVSVLAVAVAAPGTVDAKKKKPPPPKITLTSWQVVLNDSGKPIDVANNGTYTYCSDDDVTHIYAIGTAKPTTKGQKFSITWKLNGAKLVTLKDYKTRKNGKVLAPLHKTNGVLDPGTYDAVRTNAKGKSTVTITITPSDAACA